MNQKHNSTREICKQKLLHLNYSPNTIKVYCSHIDGFLNHQQKQAKDLSAADFQNYLDSRDFTSTSQQNQVISAIKFLYEKVLDRKYNKVCFQRPRRERKLPQIIPHEFLIDRINSTQNLKHKSILTLTYSVGLRVSEVINLKISDIDSKRMVIRVNNAKGQKDRIAPLSKNCLMLLQKYFRHHKPQGYLFNGQSSPQYSTESCRKIIKRHVGAQYWFHLLRHSCFTRLLEKGDIKIIQLLAGHNDSRSTEIYMHLSTKQLGKLELPI